MVKEIGARLQLDSGTLTPILKRLEASGYIRRTRLPENQRQLRVELTDSGRALRSKALVLRENLGCAIGGSVERIRETKHGLEEIIGSLRRSGAS